MNDTAESNPWDESAAGWDDEPAVQKYAAAAFGSLVAALDERGLSVSGATVLDFGCGTGLLTEQLVRDAESIDAVDTSTAMIRALAAKVATRGWRHVRTSEEIPASTRSHDLVVCSSVCSFVDDYPGTVQQLVALLRPGGTFVQWDWERDDTASTDDDGLSRSEIGRALDAAGLVSVHVDTAFRVEIYDQVMRPLIGIGQTPR